MTEVIEVHNCPVSRRHITVHASVPAGPSWSRRNDVISAMLQKLAAELRKCPFQVHGVHFSEAGESLLLWADVEDVSHAPEPVSHSP